MRLLLVHSFLLAIGFAHASVYRPYVQQPYGIVTAASASYTSAASYDDVILTLPPLPNPPPTSFGVQLQTGAISGISIPHQGSFFLDLQTNGDEFTPGYAIYENGHPTRVALINLVDDNSGASDYTASISVGGTVPSQVRVEYLSASSVAGQTFGDVFSSDGPPAGVVDVQTVDCDQTNNVCNVKVPAPGAALVFLSDQALAEWDQVPTTTVDPAALATSNGNKCIADALAATSQGVGIRGAFGLAHALPSVGALIAVCAFVCIESLLVYAVTGKSLLGSVSDMTKNTR
jgi:hypothetical protein